MPPGTPVGGFPAALARRSAPSHRLPLPRMLPISNVAIPNVQFQLELATLATGNISTLVTFSRLSSAVRNLHADDAAASCYPVD